MLYAFAGLFIALVATIRMAMHMMPTASLLPRPDSPPIHQTVTGWLEHGMRQHPDAPALHFEDRTTSHRQLDELSSRVAGFLAGQGIAKGDRVGLCIDRSPGMIIALIGILKAGAAYVPLDPAYPSERLAMMEEDAGLKLLLLNKRHRNRFSRDPAIHHAWEEVEAALDGSQDGVPEARAESETVAYIIFTSGSTGRPKGIAMPQRALANLVEWQLERSTFRPSARVLQYSSISFDVSFQEIATTIASGGCLYLVHDADRRDPRLLLQHLHQHRIQRLFLPYVAMRSFMETALAANTCPRDLKEIITAGEQLRVDETVRRYFEQVEGATLDNQYGPSETHVITGHLLEGDPRQWPELPPIGLPLKNCGTCILDESGKAVEQGESGELFLAGRNLAHGYTGRDDLTREVFVKNPFDVPDRPLLYRTGDLASYNPDGTIAFLGRRDHQVKIRGHRIEPGEINNAVADFPGVSHSLTHAVKTGGDILQLATWYTESGDRPVDRDALRRHLADRLPDYMVPAFLVRIDKVPYTPSGKVDLKALPQPSIETSRYAGESAIYESATEKRLAVIWSELLGLEKIPRTADFFELGGDSLRAVTLFLKIQEDFGKDLPLASLAHAPTIAGLADLVDEKADGPNLSGYRSLKMIRHGSSGEVPLFLVHGGLGNVLVFNTLGKLLTPGQPVYAFQWSGWDGRPGETSIESMARAYLNELEHFCPEGPVRIGGYCIGGMIAIELAYLLTERGRRVVEPLIIWDSPNLHSRHYRASEPWDSAETIRDFNRMKTALKEIRIQTSARPMPEADSVYSPPTGKGALIRSIPLLLPALRKARELADSLKHAPEWWAIRSALLRRQPVPMHHRSHFCVRSMVGAVKRYTCRSYRGDVLYFRSDCVVGRHFALTGWWDDPFLGFAELCEGNFEAHAVGGGHIDILEIPEMAGIVNETLLRDTRQLSV